MFDAEPLRELSRAYALKANLIEQIERFGNYGFTIQLDHLHNLSVIGNLVNWPIADRFDDFAGSLAPSKKGSPGSMCQDLKGALAVSRSACRLCCPTAFMNSAEILALSWS